MTCGHVNVPSADERYASLYKWIIEQRYLWRKVIKGEKSTLHQEQINLLVRLGLGTHTGGPTAIPVTRPTWSESFKTALGIQSYKWTYSRSSDL